MVSALLSFVGNQSRDSREHKLCQKQNINVGACSTDDVAVYIIIIIIIITYIYD